MLLGISRYKKDLFLYPSTPVTSEDTHHMNDMNVGGQVQVREQKPSISQKSSTAIQVITYKVLLSEDPRSNRTYDSRFEEGLTIFPGQSLPCGLGLKSQGWGRV